MKNNTAIVPIVNNSIYVEHYFFLHTSSNFIQDLSTKLVSLERFVRDISHLKSIWIKPLKNSNYYEILLPESILLCSMTDNGIELNGIYEKNIRNHAQFIKEGIILGLNKDIIVVHQNVVQNRQVIKNIRHEEIHMKDVITSVNDKFNCIFDKQHHIETEVNHKFYEKEFENWLNLYDQSALQHLESNIISQPQIRYIEINADSMFGPFTLSFLIDSILPIPLTYGHYFYVKLLNGEWINGLLTERYVDHNKNVVVIQFNRLFEVSEFSKQGDLFLFLNKPIEENKLYEIYYNQLDSSNILKLLITNQIDTNNLKMKEVPFQIISQFNLDTEQLNTVKNAIEAKSIYYIEGAVSTGKTKVLHAIRAYYESIQERVLYITANEIDILYDGNDLESLPKKFTSLKQKTLTSLNKFEQLVIADKKLITSFASDTLDLNLAESEHITLTEYLEQFYTSFKLNYYDSLCHLYDEFTQNELKLIQLYEKLQLAEKKLNELNEKSEFSKWIILPVLLGQQASIKKKYEQYNKLLDRQFEIKGLYNDLMNKVKLILSDEQFITKKELWHLQKKHINSLKEKLSTPIELQSISITRKKTDHNLYTKDEILDVTNQLEHLHQSIKEYKQMLLSKDERMFFSIFIKEKKSLQASMKLLHDHFSLFTNEFDIVLIDDAQSYTVLELFLAISLGKKVIVTGDQYQNAVVREGKTYLDDIYNTEPQAFQMSAALSLAKLLPVSCMSRLNYLYRVMPALTTVYNQVIFSEESKNRNKTEVKRVETLKNISNPLMVLTTSQTRNKYESEITGYGIYNHCEATAIVDLVVSILTRSEKEKYRRPNTNSDFIPIRIKPEDILITSFFDMQIEYIRTHLRYALPYLSKETINNMVLPLISCTGIEQKVVFLSLCASNKNADMSRDLFELRHSHLWNIALSRAKHQLIIIGDIDYIKNSTSHERKTNKAILTQYDWSSYDVARVMKLFLKLAMQGELQFVSLETFSKQLLQVNGGFGYEQYD